MYWRQHQTNDRAVNAVAGLREGQDAKDIPAIAFGGGSRSGRGCRPFRFIVLHAFLSYNLMSQHSRHASGRTLSEERSHRKRGRSKLDEIRAEARSVGTEGVNTLRT